MPLERWPAIAQTGKIASYDLRSILASSRTSRALLASTALAGILASLSFAPPAHAQTVTTNGDVTIGYVAPRTPVLPGPQPNPWIIDGTPQFPLDLHVGDTAAGSLAIENGGEVNQPTGPE